MKPYLVALSLAIWSLASPLEVHAESSKTPSVRIVAQSLSSGREVKHTRAKSSSAAKRETKTRKVVEVRISTTKSDPQNVTLEALLIVEREGESSCRSFGKRRIVELEAGKPQSHEFSTEVEESWQRKAKGEVTKKGERYRGWVIRAYSAEQEVVAVCASLKHFEALAFEHPVH